MLEQVSMHFRPEEKPFIQRAEEWILRASKQHRIQVTHFLNPRQSNILQILGRTIGDVSITSFGGPVFAERVRAVIAPEYREPEETDADLAVLRVHAGVHGEKLTHGDYLGGFLGAGITREKIGDLYVRNDGCDIVVASELVSYWLQNVRSIGRFPVEIEQIPVGQIIAQEPKLDVRTVTVASLRLDAAASEGFKISRTKIVERIRAGTCQLNWQVVTQPSHEVYPGDVISLRGYGRIRILETGDRSKKGRLFITVGKYL